jgi:hypothetical protein
MLARQVAQQVCPCCGPSRICLDARAITKSVAQWYIGSQRQVLLIGAVPAPSQTESDARLANRTKSLGEHER